MNEIEKDEKGRGKKEKKNKVKDLEKEFVRNY